MVGLSAAEGEAGLRRLARLLHEAAGAFYLDDARRRLAAHAERRAAPPELSARVAFKVRQDQSAVMTRRQDTLGLFIQTQSLECGAGGGAGGVPRGLGDGGEDVPDGVRGAVPRAARRHRAAAALGRAVRGR